MRLIVKVTAPRDDDLSPVSKPEVLCWIQMEVLMSGWDYVREQEDTVISSDGIWLFFLSRLWIGLCFGTTWWWWLFWNTFDGLYDRKKPDDMMMMICFWKDSKMTGMDAVPFGWFCSDFTPTLDYVLSRTKRDASFQMVLSFLNFLLPKITISFVFDGQNDLRWCQTRMTASLSCWSDVERGILGLFFASGLGLRLGRRIVTMMMSVKRKWWDNRRRKKKMTSEMGVEARVKTFSFWRTRDDDDHEASELCSSHWLQETSASDCKMRPHHIEGETESETELEVSSLGADVSFYRLPLDQTFRV